MVIDPELIREIEFGAAARREARSARENSARLRHALETSRARQNLPADERSPLLLLSIVERLIDAHVLARVENDGTTVDVIQDALHHVGKRLAKETNAEGRSAQTILGYYRKEREGSPHRDRPQSG